MGWLQNKLPNLPINNFTTDWKDGRKVSSKIRDIRVKKEETIITVGDRKNRHLRNLVTE
jgi:hypothetical protein